MRQDSSRAGVPVEVYVGDRDTTVLVDARVRFAFERVLGTIRTDGSYEMVRLVGDMTVSPQLTDSSDGSTKVAKNGCLRDTQLALHRQLGLHVDVTKRSANYSNQR